VVRVLPASEHGAARLHAPVRARLGALRVPLVIVAALTAQFVQSTTSEAWEPPVGVPLVGGYSVVSQSGDDLSWHFVQIAEG
jgi:hypothetical protein